MTTQQTDTRRALEAAIHLIEALNLQPALALGVVSEALPVDDDAGFVADCPRVVSWGHDSEVSRAELHLLAVIHDDLHPARDEVAHVSGLAAVGLGNGLDMFRPLPSRLEGRAADCSGFEIHQFDLALAVMKRPGLLRRIKALSYQSGHFPPWVIDVGGA